MIRRHSPRKPWWLRALLLVGSTFAAGFLARSRTHVPGEAAAPLPVLPEAVAPPPPEVLPPAPRPQVPLADLPPPVALAIETESPPVEVRAREAGSPDAAPTGRRLPSPRAAVGGAMLFLVAMAISLMAAALLSGSPSSSAGQPHADATTGHPANRFSSRELSASGRPRGSSVVARARHGSVRIYRTAHGRRPYARLSRRIVNGKHIPLVFLVDGRRGDWLHVRLPVRPNGTRAWLRRRDVTLALTQYRIVIDVHRHRLTLLKLGRAVDHERIATGGTVTPTPNGRYYLTDLLRPPDPNGLYGPYAFGTSAFSSVLTNFAGGAGQIGLHGTDTPAVLGTDVSHGCIRVRNGTIRRFAKRLPLGTPIRITGGVKPQAVATPATQPAAAPSAPTGYTLSTH